MASALRGIDAVCHQAAKVGRGVDIGDAPDYTASNSLGTAVLLSIVLGLPLGIADAMEARADEFADLLDL